MFVRVLTGGTKMRRMLWALVMVMGGLGIAAHAGQAAETQFDRVLPLPPGGQFALENVNGSVQVTGWEREAVEIEAVKTGEHDAAELDLVKIDVQSNADRIAVHTIYPAGEGVAVAVEYHIRVPYRVWLTDVETVNGSIRVRGVQGAGELRTVNGDVRVVNSSGRFSGQTTNGDVHFELKQMPEGAPMKVSTVNGSVLLELPSNAAASLHVQNLNGGFVSEFPIRSKTSDGSRIFRGTLGAGGGDLYLSAMNGSIRLVIDRPTV
jgi:DUF4097 and DUF4098 domain-containing protein YvlB